MKTIVEQGCRTPSPIQIEAIPAVFSQSDVIAVARTGTGKTAGFSLLMLQLLSVSPMQDDLSLKSQCVRALVIMPTRELTAQVASSIQNYSRHMIIRIEVVFAGVKIEPQLS